MPSDDRGAGKVIFRLDEHELDETRRWLEQPDHHLLRGDDPRYPLRLKAIADYPGALLVAAASPCFTARSLPLLAVARTRYGACWETV